jgi:hypothetical protein
MIIMDTLSTDHTVSKRNVSHKDRIHTVNDEDVFLVPDAPPTDLSIEVPTYGDPTDDYHEDKVGEVQTTVDVTDQEQIHTPEPATVPRYDLRPSRQRTYTHRLDHFH